MDFFIKIFERIKIVEPCEDCISVKEVRKFDETENMYTTIKGHYEKGKLILEEAPPSQQADVLVIFQNDVHEPKRQAPRFGYGKGMVTYMADDFNEPLDDLKDYM